MLTALLGTKPAGDRELVSRCVEGDAAAWKELILRYERLIYSVARRYFQDSADTGDVFQEVALELYRNLDKIRDPKALPAWLITVTRRKCRAAMRGNDRRSESCLEAEVSDPRTHGAFERRFWVEDAVGRLSERCRALVRALYFEPDQPSYAEIADRFGMPVASIGPTRARCLEKLRKLVEEE